MSAPVPASFAAPRGGARRTSRGRAGAAAALAILCATGCSDGPGGDRLFPLGEGHAWTYRVTTVIDEDGTSQRSTHEVVNRGHDRFDGEPAWRRRTLDGNDYGLRVDETGIYRVASKNALDPAPKSDVDRRYVLRLPIAVGTQWQASTLPYVLARTNEVPQALRHFVKPITMVYRIDALGEQVEVPAGRFGGCVRVRARNRADAATDHILEITYAPGVGPVRLETVVVVSGKSTPQVKALLQRYKVQGR